MKLTKIRYLKLEDLNKNCSHKLNLYEIFNKKINIIINFLEEKYIIAVASCIENTLFLYPLMVDRWYADYMLYVYRLCICIYVYM